MRFRWAMVVGTLACVVAAACGSFSADAPDTPQGDGDGGGDGGGALGDAGGSGDADTHTDGASDVDALVPTDAADDGNPVTSPLCLDLTAGSQNFNAATTGGASVAAGANGLTINFGASVADIFAAWQRSILAPSTSTGARVSVDLVLTLPGPLPSGDYHTTLLALVNGTPTNSDTRPFVQFLLANGTTNAQAELNIARFPTGTSGQPAGTPFPVTSFDPLADAGAQPVTLVADVTWSTGTGMNVSASLADTVPLNGPSGATLASARLPLLGILLGGSHRDVPAEITYKKVCYSFH